MNWWRYRASPKRWRSRRLSIILSFGMMFFGVTCLAATDDAAFQDCRDELNRDPDVMPGQVWINPPVDAAVQKAIQPELKYEGTILRWTYLVNEDGSKTVVVMIRDAVIPQLVDDPDGFDVFMERGDKAVEKDSVAASSFAFSSYETDHVNGLFFCTKGFIYPEWDWDGSDWSP